MSGVAKIETIDLIGKTLQNGKYLLEQELGQGGFGLTYKATNQILNHTVVIKTLNSSLQQDSNLAQSIHQFQDEAQRLAKCSHRNIVRVSDFFIEDGLPYIVMEYIPGSTLDAIVVPNSPLPETTAIDYIRQVGSALKVVHQNGLLHRDVKPQNMILRQGTEEVILIDFGIAREFFSGSIQTHTRIISEGYAPIEQYLPKAPRTPATDVYGLAATLYTLLTAEIPVGSTLRSYVPLPSPKDIRPELSEMVSNAVMRGMEVEAEQRPSSVDEWLTLFGQLPSNSPSVSEKASSIFVLATTPAVTKPRRSFAKAENFRKWFSVGTLALAGVIVFLSYAWWRFQPKFQAPSTQLNQPDWQKSTESLKLPTGGSQTQKQKAIEFSPNSQISTPSIPSQPVEPNTPVNPGISRPDTFSSPKYDPEQAKKAREKAREKLKKAIEKTGQGGEFGRDDGGESGGDYGGESGGN